MSKKESTGRATKTSKAALVKKARRKPITQQTLRRMIWKAQQGLAIMTAVNIALDEESFSQYTACTALEVAHEWWTRRSISSSATSIAAH
jgi:hypothetical protein